jgi:hypothetical protein
MANVTILQLPTAGSLTGSESVPVVQNGVTVQTTTSSIASVILSTGVLPVANGGTNISSYAVGDILYASTPGVLSKLADVATGNALISGGVGVAPSYGKIGLATHISGTLPVANGGTNATTASITSFNNITGYTAAGATGTTSTNLVFSASPTFTGTLGAAAITASTTLGVTGLSTLSGGVTETTTVALPATTGTARSDFQRIIDVVGSRTADYGISNSGAWIQSRDKNDYSINYPLLLNPNGGDITVGANIIQGTAAKGINFTANTGAAGKTSQLLNWYEDGTWTPGFATWSTVPTVSAAYYTRVGRQVTINLYLFGGVHAGGYISGLPFTSGSGAAGSWCCSNTPSIYGNTYILPGAAYLGLNSITMTVNYWQFGITYFV